MCSDLNFIAAPPVPSHVLPVALSACFIQGPVWMQVRKLAWPDTEEEYAESEPQESSEPAA